MGSSGCRWCALGDHAADVSRRQLLSISVLPPAWQTITLFNPVVYLVSGFRWSFFEVADVNVVVSLAMTAVFLGACLTGVWWIFKTGYRLKS